MTVRALSGILITRGHDTGEVFIHFHDHRVTGSLNSAYHKQEIGPAGTFSKQPCKIVSLRELKVKADMDIPRNADIDFFRLNDTLISNDCLKIEWNATGGSAIEEISYMIIGDVEEQSD